MLDIRRTDFAANDPRSVKAMLENRDDGRGMAYEAFRREELRRNPGLSEGALAARFRDAMANGWLDRKRTLALAALAACALYTFAVTYWVFAKDMSGLLQ